MRLRESGVGSCCPFLAEIPVAFYGRVYRMWVGSLVESSVLRTNHVGDLNGLRIASYLTGDFFRVSGVAPTRSV